MLLSRLRLRQVALLLGIEKHGTLHAASAELGMTQPAATKMLRELENALGFPLFTRIGRSLRPNVAGQCATAHFRGLRGSLETMQRDLQSLRLGSGGKLFIGAIMAAAQADLSPALVRLKERYPLLTLMISVETSDRLMGLLAEGHLDIVVGRMSAHTGGNFQFRAIGQEALAIVAAPTHPLARQAKIRFADMQAFPWILQPKGSPMRDVIEHEFAAHGTPLPVGLIETASIVTTTSMLTNTKMIAVIPWSLASHYEQHGMLRILRYKMRNRLSAYGSIIRQDRLVSDALIYLLELLHEPGSESSP